MLRLHRGRRRAFRCCDRRAAAGSELILGLVFRRPDRDERWLAWLWAGAAVAALALTPLWLELARYLPGCVFHRLTGVPCPSCGTTRAALALLHLDPLGALAHNPLATMAGVGFLLGGLAAPLYVALGGRVPELTHLPRPARIAILAALALNWAWVIAVGD